MKLTTMDTTLNNLNGGKESTVKQVEETKTKELTFVNFLLNKDDIAFANSKTTTIKLGEGHLYVRTVHVRKQSKTTASVGIAKEWEYSYSSGKGAKVEKVSGEAVIQSLKQLFNIAPKLDAFTIATMD